MRTFWYTKSKIFHLYQTHSPTDNKESPSGRKKVIPERGMNLHKGIKGTRNDNYKLSFVMIQICKNFFLIT